MGRGRKGSGVEVRGDAIRIRFSYLGRRCTEPLSIKATPQNIKAAERMAVEIRNQIEWGSFDYTKTFPDSKTVKPREIPTFRAYVDTWLATLTCEKSTADGYRTSLKNFWCHEFDGKRISEIRHTDVAKAVAKKAAAASAKTTNNHLIALRGLFAAAIADGHVSASPAANVHNRRHQRQPPDPFDREEMEKIVARLAEPGRPREVWAYFEFAFNTGLRTSEQIALKWGNIDWQAKSARIDAARVRHKVKGTKTHSVRDVDLNDRALAALRVMKEKTFMKGPNEIVFADPTGRPWTSDRKQREDYFLPVLKALGIRYRRAYSTRHTYATLAIMAGVNLVYVARQLGHKDTTMLLKHYAKWIDRADKGVEAEKLNAAFGAKAGNRHADDTSRTG